MSFEAHILSHVNWTHIAICLYVAAVAAFHCSRFRSGKE